MRMIRPLEGFLIQTILYLFLWLWDDYAASLISIIFIAITFFVLVVSLISELIERSKVPRSYFVWILITLFAPLLAGLVYISFMGGELEWFKQ